jgi:hypothetical protein
MEPNGAEWSRDESSGVEWRRVVSVVSCGAVCVVSCEGLWWRVAASGRRIGGDVATVDEPHVEPSGGVSTRIELSGVVSSRVGRVRACGACVEGYRAV